MEHVHLRTTWQPCRVECLDKISFPQIYTHYGPNLVSLLIFALLWETIVHSQKFTTSFFRFHVSLRQHFDNSFIEKVKPSNFKDTGIVDCYIIPFIFVRESSFLLPQLWKWRRPWHPMNKSHALFGPSWHPRGAYFKPCVFVVMRSSFQPLNHSITRC